MARVAKSDGVGIGVESFAARLTKLEEPGSGSVKVPTVRLAGLELGNNFLSQIVKHLFVSQQVFTEHRAVGGQSSFELQSFKVLQLAPAPAQKLWPPVSEKQ